MRLLLIVLLSIFIFASEDDKKEERYHIPKDLSFLHLQKSQKKSIKKVLKEHRSALKKLHEIEEELEDALKDEFKKDRFNKEKFLEENIKLKAKIAKIEADFFAKIHKILTKEQRDKFIEHIEEWEVE